jgi:hypothetical protein
MVASPLLSRCPEIRGKVPRLALPFPWYYDRCALGADKKKIQNTCQATAKTHPTLGIPPATKREVVPAVGSMDSYR